ncbi:Long-chain-fatty-acid--CoA ligase [Brevinematales bacterium NS]|nr:Long-chain-fatty-acid--CoA ligase [Brevinematales bacterium NS]
MKTPSHLRCEVNFVERLEKTLKENWDRMAVSDYGGKTAYTYGECARMFLAIHHFFADCRLKKGERVAILGRNAANWAVSYLATISYGAVTVPLLPDFHPEDIVHLLNHSESKVLFVLPSLFEGIDTESLSSLEVAVSLLDMEILWQKKEKKITSIPQHYSQLSLRKESFALPKVGTHEWASLVYTSGTTGFSKGVCLSCSNLMSNIVYAQDTMPLFAGETILSFLPIAHSFGCAFEFLFPFFTGCHIHFLSKTPTPTVLLEAFARVRPSLILSVPLIIEKMYYKKIKPSLEKAIVKILRALPGVNRTIKKKIRNQLVAAFGGNFREVVIGGAAFSQEVEDFLRSIEFPFTVGYGMTECAPLISYSRWTEYAPRSVGRVVDRMEVKIVPLHEGDTSGEILVRGANVMSGYYKNPEATKETIDRDGWLHTGDMGYMDKNGFLYINGRCKTMLLGPSGQNIYPEEIEAKLNVMPYVQESLVVSRDHQLVGLVYPDMERVDREKLSESQLREIMEQNRKTLNEKLPAYAKVVRIEIMPEEFEKTPKKSIKRFLYS